MYLFFYNSLLHPIHPDFASICIFQSYSVIRVQQTQDLVNNPTTNTKQSLQVLHQLPGSSRDLLSMFRAPFSALYSLVLTALFEMSLSAVFSSLIRGGVWLKHSQTLQNTPKHSQTLLVSTYSLKKKYLVLHCSPIQCLWGSQNTSAFL